VSLRTHRIVCAVLGALALPTLLLCHLALTDIRHGESDLAAEWTVLRIGLLVLTAFVVATLTLLPRNRTREEPR
jgi:hypothetical protein